MAVATFSGRPPADAVAYLRDKVPGGRFSFDHRDVVQEEHVTSFVVAKMGAQDLATDTLNALLKAIETGQTREGFIQDLRPTLQKAGWWRKKAQTDPVTGESRIVQLGSPHRLATIFDTNMRMAYAAGRWQRFEETRATHPYLMYTAVLDGRTRPQHAAWGGRGAIRIILPIDHPFWKTHFPPNGWRCRCTVSAVSEAFLQARGLAVTTEEELAATDWNKPLAVRNARTGRTTLVPPGIDPGFAYNVGQARRAALVPPPTLQPQNATVVGERLPRTLPKLLKARPYPDGIGRRPELPGDQAFKAFSKALGVPDDGVFFDRTQIPLAIGPQLFDPVNGDGRAAWAEIFAAALKDPDEIWVAAEIRKGGATRMVRSYVASFTDPTGETYRVALVIGGRDGWWYEVRALGGKGGDVDRDGRVGTLVYRRK